MSETTCSEADSALVARFRQGDPRAFDEIVRRHREVVYRVARRLLGSHHDADEAAQQAFVRAWRALGRFRGESELRTWLVRIVLNVAKSLRGSRRPTDGLESWDPVADAAESGEERLDRGRAGRRVRQAVDGLPPRQREVVVLKVFGEMTYGEVARIMELSEGTVKAHLHQAVANLRRRMSRESTVGSS